MLVIFSCLKQLIARRQVSSVVEYWNKRVWFPLVGHLFWGQGASMILRERRLNLLVLRHLYYDWLQGAASWFVPQSLWHMLCWCQGVEGSPGVDHTVHCSTTARVYVSVLYSWASVIDFVFGIFLALVIRLCFLVRKHQQLLVCL